jgi:hypothetical protein
MTYLTPKDAGKMICPIARCQGTEKVQPKCVGDKCILWRWKELMASDPRFMSAIKREEALLSGETGKSAAAVHKHAVANVMKYPEGYGVTRELGFCGLGGVPS